MVFDPVLAYSTYLGGTNFAGPAGVPQGATAMFVDNAGNTYVAGSTNSTNFPVTTGVVRSSDPQQSTLGFVAIIDPTGHTLIFSTYIRNRRSLVDDRGPSRSIYVTGRARDCAPSPNCTGPFPLPIPSGTAPFQATPKGFGLAIVKLNNTATTLLGATYLGGRGFELAVDSGGLYVTGLTSSNDFPSHSPLQSALGSSGNNPFVTKLSLDLRRR